MHARIPTPHQHQHHKPEPAATAATPAQNHVSFHDVALQQTASFDMRPNNQRQPNSAHGGFAYPQYSHVAERNAEATGGESVDASFLGKQSTGSKGITYIHALTSAHIRRAGRVRLDLGRLSKLGGVATKAAVDLFHFKKQQPAGDRPTTPDAAPCPNTTEYDDNSDGKPVRSLQVPLQHSPQPAINYSRYCRPPIFGPPEQSNYATMYVFNKNAVVYPPQFQDIDDMPSDSSTMYNSGEEEDNFRLVEIMRTEVITRSMPQLVNVNCSGNSYSIVPAH
ncbi:hypothetical protein H4217_001090 [Coemansia sp. RSA 1939]|nr:hypothetical protein H4217_001090 [Coemansia sp. RSA 1939]